MFVGIKYKEVDLGDDECDKFIELKSIKFGYWFCFVIILMCVFLIM